MKPVPGKVYLIGAGPGDPGLLTLKGAERLSRADVVLYDGLVNPDVLKFANPEARFVYVGKRLRTPAHAQENINQALVREAERGRTVARLKGGDPYLFGRGAEEASHLRASGIDFEVIPGITSAMACATYAGIPLTDRHLGSSVAFITGHLAGKGALPRMDWKALTRAVDTLVVYMGASKIGDITQLLLQNGSRPSTPAAVIEWGSRTRQRSCFATVGTIAAKVAQKGVGSPAILIVGKVIAMAGELNWFERLPLFGKKIVITRAEAQAEALKSRLEDLGAQVIELPAIRIAPPSDFGPMDKALAALESFDWVLFTSPNGVDAFFNRLTGHFGRDARAFGSAQVAAVGPGTRFELSLRGVQSDFVPHRFTTDALFDEIHASFKPLKRKRFLLVRTDAASDELDAKLRRAGAHVTRVTAYRTLNPSAAIRSRLKLLENERPDILSFTSASTASNLLKAAPRGQFQKIFKNARIVSIGPATTAALKKNRTAISREAVVHTIEGLVDAILVEAAKGKKS